MSSPVDTSPPEAGAGRRMPCDIHPAGLPSPRRWVPGLAIWLAITMAVLDSAIANVALPTIARDFGAAPSESIWIVNAYQLAIVTSLLPLASLGEIVGYRRIFRAGPDWRCSSSLRSPALSRDRWRCSPPRARCRAWARPA